MAVATRIVSAAPQIALAVAANLTLPPLLAGGWHPDLNTLIASVVLNAILLLWQSKRWRDAR